MSRAKPTYQFGIEEELFLADSDTRRAPRRVKAFHKAVQACSPGVERELLEAQVEIMTKPCTRFADARAMLGEQRKELSRIGEDHGVLIFAAGTHPTARWKAQRHTRKERYDTIKDDMQMLARRDVVCGMHVHVEVPRPDERVDLMNRMLPFTPLFLSLSASSPYWEGDATGLDAYRLSVWGEMPRTGLPDLFADKAAYDRYVAAMVQSEAISDASFLWWMLRPSIRFPTLELRVADSCTRLEDSLTIAALYRCILRMIVRRPSVNRDITGITRAIASENMWRAQRHGVRASFIDEASGHAVPFADHLEAILAMIATDAEELGCEAEVANARTIVTQGTSADRQRQVFADAWKRSGSEKEALSGVIDWLAETTAKAS